MKKVYLVIFSVFLAVLTGCDKPENKEPVSDSTEQKQAVTTNVKQETPSVVMVKLETTKGSIIIELDREKAPITCANMINYVNDGFYNGVIFHRVMPDFMIQTGGFGPGLEKKSVRPPIKNEASNGLKNLRGSVAMARTPDPDSATSQFFINLVDNDYLNFVQDANPGYAVFGKVTEGMNVVDEIAKVGTTTIRKSPVEVYQNVPVRDIVIKSATIVK